MCTPRIRLLVGTALEILDLLNQEIRLLLVRKENPSFDQLDNPSQLNNSTIMELSIHPRVQNLSLTTPQDYPEQVKTIMEIKQYHLLVFC
ncbi:hypothetical protein A8P51_15485 [Lactiplantibacillus plantarum]|nr:hypothetical protein A8P51_15485 [Lactiplantibacillus plantarum]